MQPFWTKRGNLFGFMNKRIEAEVETDHLSSYVYVERSFYSLSVDVWYFVDALRLSG